MNSFSNLNLAIPDLWEVRDVINKVKNVVLNYTEMEAKVHEATNNEAWGASSTLMQEIAQGTYNYQYFNEIMPTIYKRFTEKEAKQWRQIYKSLVLLEYLVKNGSERVVDDARSHISMIKMMKNFHYIDEKGKDQGLNVRNRAKELAELLNNTDAIKEERAKAKKNKNKYTGVGSDGGMMYSSSGGYGGGGSYGGSGSYGGGGYGSSRFEGFGSESMGGDDMYDNYSTGKYDDLPPARETAQTEPSSKPESKPKPTTTTAKDLFDFDEPATKQSNTNEDDWGDFATGNGDDDFDDFQSAPPANSVATSSFISTTTPAPAKKSKDIFDLLGDDVIATPSAPQQPRPQTSGLVMSQPASFDPFAANNAKQSVKQESNSSGSNTPIGGIWSQASSFVSLDSLGKKAEPVRPASAGPSMNALKNSNVNTDWNNWANSNTKNTQQQQTKQPSAFDDLLF
ncbi:hypothetical protein G6F46_006281 [Rhizopus delemar]|nr:hypothetical protein G6F55_008310 [Rhizopus delemar]KAG1543950.1 hypothetical protein G6F51_006363 [Rhizopus arrhizus]KAG1497678.1 hypothetical protein G6F54_005601 [Rhizopus delemar]KAG1510855.1 hypothetical protein G6F53_006373 [Rhizopus delemar]KAG1519853.1 hypothetical protein G6F52_008219 [Rhizopus delemar]